MQLSPAVSESSRGLKEALSILSESALLQWTQTLQRITIHQHETLSSNIASAKDPLEGVAAEIADAASLVGQIPFSGSDQSAASTVRTKGTQDFIKSECELMEGVDTL